MLTTQQEVQLREELEETLLEFRDVSIKALKSKGATREYYKERRDELNETVTTLRKALGDYGV